MALVLTRGSYSWGTESYIPNVVLLTIRNTGSESVSVSKINIRCAVARSGVYYSDPNGSQATGTGNPLTIQLTCNGKTSDSVVISNLMGNSPWTEGGVTYYSSNKSDMQMAGFTFSDPIQIASGATVYVYARCTSGQNIFGAVYSNADTDDDILPPSNYTVTFNLDGGTRTGGGALTQTVTAGGTAVAPTCTKTGYTFSGWNKALGPINANTTIKANWTINKLSIVYNANGATIADAPHLANDYYYRLNGSIVERSASQTSGFTSPWHTVNYGGNMNLVNIGTMNLTRAGYKIVRGSEWRTSATGGTAFDHGEDYPINDTPGVPSVGSGNRTLTVYANWQKADYTITLKGDSGTFAAATGWTISGDTATKSVPYQETPGTIPTLTKSVTLTYNANGGTFNGTNAETSTKTLNLSHTWNTKADGTGTSYTDAQVRALTITSSLTLYAVHAAASIGALPTVGTGTSQIAARTGYRLDTASPWTTTQNGSTAVTSSTTIKANTTIWAKWEYRVIVNANGGLLFLSDTSTVSEHAQWKKHGVAATIDYIIYKVGSEVLGISTSSSATTGIGSVTLVNERFRVVYSYTGNAPITYYAIYKPETFTVTFKDGYSSRGRDVVTVIRNVQFGASIAEEHVPKVGNIYNGKVFKKPGPWGFMGWAGSYENITENTTCVAMWEFCVVWTIIEKNGERVWVPYKPDPTEPDNN